MFKVDRVFFGNDNLSKIYERLLSTIIPHGKNRDSVVSTFIRLILFWYSASYSQVHLAAFVSGWFVLFLCDFGQVSYSCVVLRENQFVEVGLAIMADRKSRSVTFKVIFSVSVGAMKTAFEHMTSQEIIVFQSLGNEEFLVELTSRNAAELLIEEGFDVNEFHVCCHPPHGYFTNVSIMGLRSYVEDAQVLEALAPYGEIKSDILRLKYRKDHELAGIENGNRLVKMVLATKSIPYSMKIGGQWCRIIHNNQQPICSECHEEGHVRRKCPQIECRLCKAKGHMSFDCTEKNVNNDAKKDPTPIPEITTLENQLDNDGDDQMHENIQGNT